MVYICKLDFGFLIPGDCLVPIIKEENYIFCWSTKYNLQFKVTPKQLDEYFNLRNH